MLIIPLGLAEDVPRFEQYPAKHFYKRRPAPANITTREESENSIVITEAVEKGWGVFDGTMGNELQRQGVNFAGHYILISFGCRDSYSGLLCVAIVDAKTGQIFKQPIPESGNEYKPFAVPVGDLPPHPYSSFHNFKFKSPIAYRLNSRLLVVDLCEGIRMEELPGDVIVGVSEITAGTTITS